jgi:hypothetical protein
LEEVGMDGKTKLKKERTEIGWEDVDWFNPAGITYGGPL